MNSHPDGRYAHVRALTRGLEVLSALNRLGPSSPKDLSEATGIDRGTVYRLLETLSNDGFVTRNATSGVFTLTAKVRQLSDGFTLRDDLAVAVASRLGGLLSKVSWPSDFAVFDKGVMLIRETTHPFSPFSIHRAMVGRSRPVLHTALGRAVISAASPQQRSAMLRLIAAARQSDARDANDPQLVRRIIADVTARGYAASAGAVEDKIAAIALPVIIRGTPIGAVNVIFFRSAHSISEAARRYLPALRRTVEDIQDDLTKNRARSSRSPPA